MRIRVRRLVLLAAWLLASAGSGTMLSPAAGGDEPEQAQAEQEIRALFEELQKAGLEADGKTLVAKLHIPEMMNQAYQVADLKLSFAERVGVNLALNYQLRTEMADTFADWHKFKVSKIQFFDEGKRATALVRSYDDYGTTSRQQFWLIHTTNGWRYYDIEQVDLAMRYSVLIGMAIADSQAGAERDLLDAFQKIEQLSDAVLDGDYYTADELIAEIGDEPLPKTVEGVRWLLFATVQLETSEPEAGLKSLDRLLLYQPDCPMVLFLRAEAYNQLGEPEKALEHARQYVQQFGDDPDAQLQIGGALEQLGRTEEAMTAYRKGLDDIPDSLDNLVALGVLLPPEGKAELGQRLADVSHPQDKFEYLVSSYHDHGDAAAMHALIDAYQQMQPDDTDIGYYRALALQLEGKPAEGAKIVFEAWLREKDEDQQYFFMSTFLDLKVAAGEVVEGYQMAPDKMQAFEYLANDLIIGDNYEAARAVLEEHGKTFADDPNLHYQWGDFYYYQEKWAEADAAYAVASEKKPDDDLAESIRYSRLLCWSALGKGVAAYQEFGPGEEAFDDIAWQLLEYKHFKELERLIEIYEQQAETTANIIVLKAHIAYHVGDYERALKLVDDKKLEDEDDYYSYMRDDLKLRAMLRLKRWDGATMLANEQSGGQEISMPMLLVHAAQGNVEHSKQLVETLMTDDYYWFPEEFLADDMLKEIFQTPEFAPVKELLDKRQKELDAMNDQDPS